MFALPHGMECVGISFVKQLGLLLEVVSGGELEEKDESGGEVG